MYCSLVCNTGRREKNSVSGIGLTKKKGLSWRREALRGGRVSDPVDIRFFVRSANAELGQLIGIGRNLFAEIVCVPKWRGRRSAI